MIGMMATITVFTNDHIERIFIESAAQCPFIKSTTNPRAEWVKQLDGELNARKFPTTIAFSHSNES